jgi:hydroxypyruvate isomerase
MPRFAANLSMMFTEWAFLDRFDAAAEAGFKAVEFLFPYEHPAEAIGERLSRNGLTQALFNLPPGDSAAGERGLAALPGRFGEVQAGLETAKDYIAATGVSRVHLMAGLIDSDSLEAQSAYRRAVDYCAGELAPLGVDLLLEPINKRNVPGYFLNDFNWTVDFIKFIDLPNVKLQFDLYHRQIIHGDVTMALRALMPLTGHLQTAAVPARHEPMSGEVNDAFVFAELDRLGYDGFVGCEYNPRSGTLNGLGWFAPYQESQT